MFRRCEKDSVCITEYLDKDLGGGGDLSLLAGFLPFSSGEMTLGESEENIPRGTRPKHGNARSSTSTSKRSRSWQMPAVGFQKPYRILGYASPKVSQGDESSPSLEVPIVPLSPLYQLYPKPKDKRQAHQSCSCQLSWQCPG